MLEIIFIILSVCCLILGLLGCVLPAIPGPPLSYGALLLIHFAHTPPLFSLSFLIITALAVILASLIDYVFPLLGVKLCGATKYGMWGSIIGMIIGLLFFPPFGMILGILIGAIFGELLAGQSSGKALKAGLVSCIATLATMIIKLSLSAILSFYYISALIKNFT